MPVLLDSLRYHADPGDNRGDGADMYEPRPPGRRRRDVVAQHVEEETVTMVTCTGEALWYPPPDHLVCVEECSMVRLINIT